MSRRLFTFVTIPLFTLGAAGCAAPSPHAGLEAVEVRDRHGLEKLELLGPQVGRTTAGDVHKAIGPPDYATDDGLFWAYYLEVYETAERMNWFIGLMSDDEEDQLTAYGRRLVVMQFDPSGVLRRQCRRRIPSDLLPSEDFVAVTDRWRREAE